MIFLRSSPLASSSSLSAYSFLHGYCLDFAAALSIEFGYPLVTVRDEEENLIHAFCVTESHGLPIFLDIRGATSDSECFFEEFEDFLTFENGQLYTLTADAMVQRYATLGEYLDRHGNTNLYLGAASALISGNYDYYNVQSAEIQKRILQDVSRTQKPSMPSLNNQILSASSRTLLSHSTSSNGHSKEEFKKISR